MSTVESSLKEGIPVLIIGYNRSDFISNLIDFVSQKRKLIYVFVDGPKNMDDVGAIQTAETVQKLATLHNLQVRLSGVNLGCRKAIPTAIDWVLSKYESVIILEDDIWPSDSFFEFMDYCLLHFAHTENVFQVNGWAPVCSKNILPPVFLSRHAFCWGWGTWRDKWKKSNIEMANVDYVKELNYAIETSAFKTNDLFFDIWLDRLTQCAQGKDTWDYQWYLSVWMNQGKCIATSKPLTTNIGFDKRASRTKTIPNYLDTSVSESDARKHLSACLSQFQSLGLMSESKWDRYLDYLLLGVHTGTSIRESMLNFIIYISNKLKRIRHFNA